MISSLSGGPRTLQLAVVPQTIVFAGGPGQEQQFAEALRQQHQATSMLEIRHPRDVMLGADGKLPGLRVYTVTALSQICKLLSPGLSQLIDGLTGRGAKPGARCDPQLAIRTFNDVVKLRFEQIDGSAMLLDSRTKQVDGVLSRRYQRLSNYELYMRSQRFVNGKQPAVKFDEAVCRGRRMLLRYRGEAPLFEVPTVRRTMEPFLQGFHFSNSEVGECALRISTLLIRQICDSRAVGGFEEEGGRLIHVRGPKFEEGFRLLMLKVQRKAAEATVLRQHVLRIIDAKLGLSQNAEQQRLRMLKLTAQLTRAGLPRRLSQQVITRAVTVGSYADRSAPGSAAQMTQRSVYDVFNAITWVVKREPLDVRERAEQLAYELLVGRFNLK